MSQMARLIFSTLLLIILFNLIVSFTSKMANHQSIQPRCRHFCMSTVEVRPSSATSTSSKIYSVEHLNIPKYMKAPLSPRHAFGKVLTTSNRRSADMGLKLRSQYMKLRLLTREEEKTAGEFSRLGKRLESINLILTRRLRRSPTDNELAAACRLSISTVKIYQEMATQARNRLVQHNLRLVDFWTRRLLEHSKVARDISYYELVTEGVLGLTKAAENFDGRGSFIRYAQPFVRGQLYRGITRLKPGSFATFRAVMINTRAQKARSELVSSLGRLPTDGELAKSIGVKLDTLEWARTSTSAKMVSAQTVLGSENDGGDNIVTYLDMFMRADQEDFSSEDMMWHVDFNAALDCLNPQERRTISIRYGLMDGKMRTVERTADLMCMSSEAVRLIVLSALDKLRSSPFWETLANGPPQHPVTTFNGKMGALAY